MVLKKLVVFGFLMAVLAACGGTSASKREGSQLPTFPAPNPVDRTAFLEQFPLLDTAGEEAPPSHPQIHGYPLGVVLAIPDTGEGTFCSASHLGDGAIATNAHCVTQRAVLGPARYYVVFYNNRGEKKFTSLEDFLYVGSPNGDDVALLKIPADSAREWDWGGRAVARLPLREKDPMTNLEQPRAFHVKVWAFDPFRAHPTLMERYQGGAGMIFHPRSCVLSRTKPTVVGVRLLGGEQRTTLLTRNADSERHVFLDQCDVQPIHGNSGSLITLDNRFEAKIGVYHWGIGYRDTQQKYDYYEYTGNNFTLQRLHDFPEGRDFFGVGYAFAHLSATHPNLLSWQVLSPL